MADIGFWLENWWKWEFSFEGGKLIQRVQRSISEGDKDFERGGSVLKIEDGVVWGSKGGGSPWKTVALGLMS